MTTGALLTRLQAAEAENWMSGNRRLVEQGMPSSWLWKEIDGAIAFATPSIHIPMYNRTIGIAARHAPRLSELIDWYAEQGIPPRFEVCPLTANDALRSALGDHGLEPGLDDDNYRRFRIATPDENAIAKAEAAVPSPSEIEIRPLTTSHADIDTWMELDLATFGGGRAGLRQRLMATLEQPDLYRYLAFIDGAPAALGRLQLQEGVAFLNGGGTTPAFRRRGCQSALIAERVRAAHGLGADVITSLVAPDSQSDRNLARAGFELACDREIWMLRAWRAHAFYKDHQ